MGYLQCPYVFYRQIYTKKYKNAIVINSDTILTGVLEVLTHALQSMWPKLDYIFSHTQL
jgi:hypothetical protein